MNKQIRLIQAFVLGEVAEMLQILSECGAIPPIEVVQSGGVRKWVEEKKIDLSTIEENDGIKKFLLAMIEYETAHPQEFQDTKKPPLSRY